MSVLPFSHRGGFDQKPSGCRPLYLHGACGAELLTTKTADAFFAVYMRQFIPIFNITGRADSRTDAAAGTLGLVGDRARAKEPAEKIADHPPAELLNAPGRGDQL